MESRPITLRAGPDARQADACPSDDLLLAWIPGQLDAHQAAAIDAHLKTCLVCQSRLSTLKERLSPAAEGSSPVTLNCDLRPRAPRRLNEYELLAPIGRGGMGLVYRAVHSRLQREVAVKVLPHLDLADESAVIRIKRESAAAGRVRHPNIVYATDAGECEGIEYLVMELVDGTDLNKLVAALGPLPVADACEIVRQAALGLAHIESCGLVHRDVKPSNLMLDRSGTVKILDLGLALLHKHPLDDLEATQPGYLLGTADYVSPEQVDSPHDVDVRSDLYSLGCTFYRLLAGHAPFGSGAHETVGHKVAAHRGEAPADIRTLRPEVPAAVAALLAQLLAKRPTERIQHPAELAAALAPHCCGTDLAALLGRVHVPAGPPIDESRHFLEDNRPEHKLLDDKRWDADPAAAVAEASPGTTRRLSLFQPAPSAKKRLRRVPPWIAWSVALAVLIGVITATTVQRRAPIHYDLAPPHKEVQWIGYVPSTTAPLYDPLQRVLAVEPDYKTFQLIELGKYDGRPGTFSLKLSPKNRAGMGLFFGQRTEPKFGYSNVTVFQLFVIEYFPPPATAGLENYRLTRERAGIKLWPLPTLAGESLVTELFQPNAAEHLLEVKFGRRGCESVRVNGQELATLTTPEVNAAYRPEDYHGSFGLFCDRASGAAKFSDLVFTPMEN